VLEAITATAGTDNLILETLDVETERAAEQYVQVLERDTRRVGLNQPRQCRKRRVAATGPIDTLEIRVEVYGSDHGIPPRIDEDSNTMRHPQARKGPAGCSP
jgi:hypothetical protein